MKCLPEAERLTFLWYNVWHKWQWHSWIQFSQMTTLSWFTEYFQIYLFALQSNLVCLVDISKSCFYRWRNWGIEMLNALARTMQLVRVSAWIESRCVDSAWHVPACNKHLYNGWLQMTEDFFLFQNFMPFKYHNYFLPRDFQA